MVCAETSKRRARSSTITRPKARAMLRISDWRWVRPVTGHLGRKRVSHGAAVQASGQRCRSATAEEFCSQVALRSSWPARRCSIVRVLDKTGRGCETDLNHKTEEAMN